jgi:hypothetical protein
VCVFCSPCRHEIKKTFHRSINCGYMAQVSAKIVQYTQVYRVLEYSGNAGTGILLQKAGSDNIN